MVPFQRLLPTVLVCPIFNLVTVGSVTEVSVVVKLPFTQNVELFVANECIDLNKFVVDKVPKT
jgi:hypothetical protein